MSASRRTLLLAALGLTLGCGLWRRDDAPPAPSRLDLNTASAGRLETLPGITPKMARRIAEGRPYQDLDELVERGILTDRELERIADQVEIGETRR